MRALVFRGPMALAWEEVETPKLVEPRDALVRPIAVARCDLDPAIALGLYPMPAPFVMGHEMVGEVVAVGEAISNVRLGDKVMKWSGKLLQLARPLAMFVSVTR